MTRLQIEKAARAIAREAHESERRSWRRRHGKDYRIIDGNGPRHRGERVNLNVPYGELPRDYRLMRELPLRRTLRFASAAGLHFSHVSIEAVD